MQWIQPLYLKMLYQKKHHPFTSTISLLNHWHNTQIIPTFLRFLSPIFLRFSSSSFVEPKAIVMSDGLSRVGKAFKW